MLSALSSIGVAAMITASTLVAAVPQPGTTKTTPTSGKVGIKVLAVDGTGCEEGTATVDLSDDNQVFTVAYSEYIVQTGGSEKDASKNCDLQLLINPPAGYTFTIFKADFRGFAALADDTKLVLTSGYSSDFDENSAIEVTSRFRGPLFDNWAATHADPLSYGPCGAARQLDVTTELTVKAGKDAPSDTISVGVMDSFDGSLLSTYQLNWKTCS